MSSFMPSGQEMGWAYSTALGAEMHIVTTHKRQLHQPPHHVRPLSQFLWPILPK